MVKTNPTLGVPHSQGIIKGKPTDIPENLGARTRTNYNWDEFEVGDHREFDLKEAPKARSSAVQFAKGTKGTANKEARAPRTFASRTVTKGEGDKAVKVVEIWRLADPKPETSNVTTA